MSKKNTINDEGQIIPHLLDSTSDYNNFSNLSYFIGEYKKAVQDATNGPKIEEIKTEVEECYRYQRDFNKTYDNELICKTDIKIYFKDSINLTIVSS